MIYFFINLCLHLLVSSFLLLVILHFVSNNKKRTNKRGISYLLPVAVTLIFLYQVISFSVPRLLDSVGVMKQSYQSNIGTVESVGFLNHALLMDGVTYYYNPLIYKPEVGDNLLISYTPNAHFIFKVVPAPE